MGVVKGQNSTALRGAAPAVIRSKPQIVVRITGDVVIKIIDQTSVAGNR